MMTNQLKTVVKRSEWWAVGAVAAVILVGGAEWRMRQFATAHCEQVSGDLSALNGRLKTTEGQLEAPRFHAGDGLITVECLIRGLKVADLYVHGRLPVDDPESLPIIKDDLANCHEVLEGVRRDLQQRSDDRL